MRTPKIYNDNLAKRIITQDMLVDCIYSVNKRAKNWRDRERECSRRYSEKKMMCREKKEVYYMQKDELLSILKPDCIHVEEQVRRLRIYDYDERYETYDKLYPVLYRKTDYWELDDRDDGICYYDVMAPEDQYYLFYSLGTHSFHSPIDKFKLKKYPDLEQIRIEGLITHGEDISELVSVQFVDKVLDLIDSNDYTYLA